MNVIWREIKPFNQEEISKYDLNKNGIYALCTKQNSGGYNIKYIGQGNIDERLSAHISGTSNNPELTSHIKKYKMKVILAFVPIQKNRDGIEKFLYNNFKPKFNHILPPGNVSIPVNLFDLND